MGLSIIANKHKGVYAALVESVWTARRSKTVNNTNVLCMGGFVVGAVMAVEWATMLLVFPMITKGLFKNSAAFSTICSRLSPFSEAWTSCHFFV